MWQKTLCIPSCAEHTTVDPVDPVDPVCNNCLEITIDSDGAWALTNTCDGPVRGFWYKLDGGLERIISVGILQPGETISIRELPPVPPTNTLSAIFFAIPTSNGILIPGPETPFFVPLPCAIQFATTMTGRLI
jgi:hypothetical protein